MPPSTRTLAILKLPVALADTSVFESGSLSRFVSGPASLTIGIGLLATAAIAGALGVVGLFFGPLTVCVGIVAGAVPFGYGYWFAPTASGESPE